MLEESGEPTEEAPTAQSQKTGILYQYTIYYSTSAAMWAAGIQCYGPWWNLHHSFSVYIHKY